MADKKLSAKEIEDKIKELKVSALRQPTKRKNARKEIARLMTIKNKNMKENK